MPNSLANRIQLILTDAFTFFMGNFAQIASMCLPFLFGVAFFQVVMEQAYPKNSTAFMASLLLSAVVYPIYMAALIQLMARRARQEQPTNSALITAAMPQWKSLLVLKIVASFIILAGFGLLVLPGIWVWESSSVVASFIIMVGVVPGIWLWGRLAFAEFYLVLFGLTPREALQRSLQVTRGHLGLILALLFLTNIPILMLGIMVERLFGSLMANLLFQLLFTTGLATLELFVHVVLFRAFMDVVASQEGPALSPSNR